MDDLLPALLNLATGLAGLVFLVAALRVPRGQAWVRLQLVGLLIMPVAFQAMAQGVSRGTLGRASDLLAAGAGLTFVSLLFIAAGLLLARPSPE